MLNKALKGGGVEKGYRDGGEGCKSRGMSHEKR